MVQRDVNLFTASVSLSLAQEICCDELRPVYCPDVKVSEQNLQLCSDTCAHVDFKPNTHHWERPTQVPFGAPFIFFTPSTTSSLTTAHSTTCAFAQPLPVSIISQLARASVGWLSSLKYKGASSNGSLFYASFCSGTKRFCRPTNHDFHRYSTCNASSLNHKAGTPVVYTQEICPECRIYHCVCRSHLYNIPLSFDKMRIALRQETPVRRISPFLPKSSDSAGPPHSYVRRSTSV